MCLQNVERSNRELQRKVVTDVESNTGSCTVAVLALRVCVLLTSWLPGFARASPYLLLPLHSLLLSTLPP